MQNDDAQATAYADEYHNESAWIAGGQMQRAPAAILGAETLSASGESRFMVDWIDQHRQSPHLADPAFPDGCAIDVALDAPRACKLNLPRPTPGLGMWIVTCRSCGYAISLKTSGRLDDPASVRMPCRS